MAGEESYSREQVRRLLGVTERQLRAWEKSGLTPALPTYSLHELVALRTLVDLKGKRISPRRIRQAVQALRRTLQGIDNPLNEVRLLADRGRVWAEVNGYKMEPATGQLLLDFDRAELRKLVSFPRSARTEASRRTEAQHWFRQGLELESAGSVDQAFEAYRRALELDPTSTGALVNAGTIHFNARRWTEAEDLYKKALEADPDYALAHYNLGNLFDETGDRAKAFFHYQAALRLNPNYGDAHYNLALLYQCTGEVMKAIRHWKAYLKTDPSSSWAEIARRELERLRRMVVRQGSAHPASVS